ncbi:hypothetical protein [Helicovermis profundi]|uniref:Uncharacterized protein n=1 Tax=Helicovermis profundi TaxID=3065157 RepID=A0AAU9EHH0_9FIRM|nr:hypothetical protein HLPR_26030 [Clostridia bacterium S502]
MNSVSIENMLREVMRIDMEATILEKEMVELKAEKEKELRKTLKSMEFKEMKKTRKIAKKKYDQILVDAKEMEEKIFENGKKETEKLELLLSKKSESISKKVFSKLLENYINSEKSKE